MAGIVGVVALLVVLGLSLVITQDLDSRRADAAGDAAHERAKADQSREVAEQQRRDEPEAPDD